MIGADGPKSAVTRSLYPNYGKSIPWFMVGQKFHGIETCPLDPDYFHFWFHPELGHYTWSHARDGRQMSPREYIVLDDAASEEGDGVPPTGKILPIYPATEGLSHRTIRALVHQHLQPAQRVRAHLRGLAHQLADERGQLRTGSTPTTSGRPSASSSGRGGSTTST